MTSEQIEQPIDQSLVIRPVMEVMDIKRNLKAIRKLMRDSMTEGHDYGQIPGTKSKTLWQPGAEKLAKFFSLVPHYELLSEVIDAETGFIRKRYRCWLEHFPTGKFAGESIRVCHNYEKKYRMAYGSMRSKYDLLELENTIEGMAEKRALVAAVRQATMAAEVFSDERDEPEEAPTPTDEGVYPSDDYRKRLLADVFSTAADRGFSQSLAKASAYKIYGVDSMTKLTNEQLIDFSERLVKEFRPGATITRYDEPPEVYEGEEVF